MAGDPAVTEEELEMKTRAVSSALVSIGHDNISTASGEELRTIIDRDVLPKVAQLFKIQVPPTGLVLDMDFVDKLDQGVKAFREAKSDKPEGKSIYDGLAEAKAKGHLELLKYDKLEELNGKKTLSIAGVVSVATGKPLLDDDAYKALKALPPIYVDKLEGLFDLVEKPKAPGEPDKFKNFTDNLRILIKAGKIGVKPKEVAAAASPPPAAEQPPATQPPTASSTPPASDPAVPSDPAQPPAAASSPPAAEQPPATQPPASTSSSPAPAAEGGISPPSGPVTGDAASQPASAAAPAADAAAKPAEEPPLKTFETATEASEWAEVYLADFAKANNTISAPAPANGVFDDASKASAWSTITLIKKGLGIEPADGVYNAGVHDLIAGKLNAESASDFRATLAGYLDSDKAKGDRKLRQFLAAMKKLSAVPGTLLDAPPPPPKVGILDGFKQSIQETRDMMAQFLGDEKATSILRMVFGFVAQFLGPILGRFGINIGPIFSAIGMDEFLDEKGNISPEKMNQAMQKIYTDAARAVNDDPAKLKEEVLKRYDEEIEKGGILIKFANLFTDEQARRKALEDSLDAAAAKQELSIEERAKIFANSAQGKGEEAKAAAEAPATGAGVEVGKGAVNPPPYKQEPPAQAAPPAAPRGDETQKPPSLPPRRGDAVPERDADDVDFRALGARFLGKDDPSYQMVARAFAGTHQVDVVTAVQGVNILIGRYEQGELHVYNVNGKLGPLVANQSAGSKMIASSKLVINEGSDAKTVELLGDFHAAARARYSFDTKHTPEGRVKLRELVQKHEDAAYLLKTQHPGVLIGKAYGNTGPHVAKPMSGPYEGSVPESEPVKLLPKGSPIRHPDGSHSFTQRDTWVPLTAEEKAQRVDRVLAFDEAAKGASNEPIILHRGFSIHAAPDGETKATFRDNKKDVEGAAPPAPVVTNPYDLKETHQATADMERGR